MFAPRAIEKPENAKSPATRGFSRCAEEDSNLHPVIPDQALNLARLPIPPSARGLAQYSRAAPAGVAPSPQRSRPARRPHRSRTVRVATAFFAARARTHRRRDEQQEDERGKRAYGGQDANSLGGPGREA